MPTFCGSWEPAAADEKGFPGQTQKPWFSERYRLERGGFYCKILFDLIGRSYGPCVENCLKLESWKRVNILPLDSEIEVHCDLL